LEESLRRLQPPRERASRHVTLDQATSLAAQAFAAWSGARCSGGGSPSINAVDEGPVSCSMVQYNDAGPNQHVIVFRDDGWPYQDSSNVLGLTTLTVSNTTGEIYDADMEINSHDFTFSVGGKPVAGGDAGTDSFDLLGIICACGSPRAASFVRQCPAPRARCIAPPSPRRRSARHRRSVGEMPPKIVRNIHAHAGAR
jgi:hypothetical protein